MHISTKARVLASTSLGYLNTILYIYIQHVQHKVHANENEKRIQKQSFSSVVAFRKAVCSLVQ